MMYDEYLRRSPNSNLVVVRKVCAPTADVTKEEERLGALEVNLQPSQSVVMR